MTASAIASRPTAIAPTAVTARARGPIADGPRTRAPTAIAPMTLAVVAVGPVLWRRMLMMLDMVPPVEVCRAWHATVARSRTSTQPCYFCAPSRRLQQQRQQVEVGLLPAHCQSRLDRIRGGSPPFRKRLDLPVRMLADLGTQVR